ncbi:ATP synthase (subunit gamma, component F1) [Weissella viridescens]|jgi:F-type H+-transporting ATPase subunit gamma|uniref:ATP synthase gamma chain n=1 Tax=Weissella viridescens TaxID=1629 RepID=A0A0R2H0G5_WEIVI|nr:F0F1 ATP synthase subunit gamma [Weissella viridescens]KRN46401.1 atp synthase gamma chain (atp synthase f1 sector gamma subunit) (f-atpase gamma subunit) [Weissella viridescens]MBX4173082.1 F0F1 ATP synthase subunit gamma [Weissella viridescens]MCB6840701.1 F0F1 ATP synthase subunit gamma [Weissella viridescens]MCB6847434.1 F0F1 ATP synthase subunit gamma [Weissella viridescens]QOD86172.1 F0F1 ATP synthase subunit gamma [Weissella viridescens]
MAASLQEIQHRIESTKSTRQITSAMQMVSTAKLSKIQRSGNGYRVYAQRLSDVVAHLAAANISNVKGTLLDKRDVKKVGFLVITSDRGLVGGYNSTLIKAVMSELEARNLSKDDVVILAVGGNGADFFKKRGFNVAYEYRGVSDVPDFMEVRDIVRMVTSMYDNEVYDELVIAYQHFASRISNEIEMEQILPVDTTKLNADSNEMSAEYDMNPSPEKILETVLPQYAQSLVYGAILDAKTAEHSASVNSMSSASDNAKDVIDSLELHYNRARQAAITTEITEITGGMAALE